MSRGHVLFICGADTSGAAPHLNMAAYWLAHRGFEIHFILPGPPDRTTVKTPLGTIHGQSIPTSPALFNRLRWQLQAAAAARRWIRSRSEPFAIYIQGTVAAPAGWALSLCAPRGRMIYQTQDVLDPGRHRLWVFFERRLARRVRSVISNELNRARHLAELYGLAEHPQVVRTSLPRDWPVPGYDDAIRRDIVSRVSPTTDTSMRLVMNLGPYSDSRCSRQLVQALALLPAHIVAVFTGGDDHTVSRTLTNIAREAGVLDRIVSLDTMSFHDALRHTAACDAGILLYPNDGFGNYYQCPGRLSEYLRCGLPIVTSNFPGLEGVTRQHNLGEACDPTSPPAIAAAIRALVDTPSDESAERRRRLRLVAEQDLAYDANAARLERVVETAMNHD
ncbi:MAG: glycosyltransferase [Verrucomicrobia bacterium]|nr:glycosyltransferase [Verrucomicrobiota bacterium]MDA1087233.1 glycosyltransferase [Verrucomicrobiota bacterium]